MFLELKPGIRTALADGTLVPDSPKHMTTERLYRAVKGSRLSIRPAEYLYAVALYSPVRDEKYIYTYAYQKESNWTKYLCNLTPDSYGAQDYEFDESCYFRICVKRADGADIGTQDRKRAAKIVEFFPVEEAYEPKPWFEKEIKQISDKVKKAQEKRKDAVLLALLADTHYTVNGTWEDTAYNIRAVHREIGMQGIIHLGDITDGVTSRKVTADYAGLVLEDLEKCNIPVYVTAGNHDANYFMNNGERMDEKEQIAAYGGSAPDREKLYYRADMGDKLCFIFLSSFDAGRPVPYGFDEEQLTWLENTLSRTEKGKKVIIFSHDAPLAEMDYWSFHIWNGKRLMEILETFQKKEGRRILAFFHGHTHADAVCRRYSFPIISIGCAKCEYFTDKKPAGSHTPERRLCTASQDLWETAVIDVKGEWIDLIRFGAGGDRHIDCRKDIRTGNSERRGNRYATGAMAGKRARPETGKGKNTPKIWAHRGVSGHAPENTLPAFELAYRMGCDGIELDVQMTRDGELVVTHDERIDRVSDGQGLVGELSWKEIRKLNFNRSFPAYGRLCIPTLQEVYELLKGTGLTINLELKNSVCFYEGMEEKVLTLARETGMEERILYSSFNHYSMRRIKELDPEAEIAFLYSDGFMNMARYARENGGSAVHPAFYNLQYLSLLKECREEGVRVHVWTVNKKADMKRAAELGVDAVITNYPELCMECFERYGCS